MQLHTVEMNTNTLYTAHNVASKLNTKEIIIIIRPRLFTLVPLNFSKYFKAK